MLTWHVCLQLSYVSERQGGGPKAVEAAAAAHRLLMALGTEPSHGMLHQSGIAAADEQYTEDMCVSHKPSPGMCPCVTSA